MEAIAAELHPYFAAEDEAREKALRLCRQIVRYSANAIRAVHRQEMDTARELLTEAHKLIQELNRDLSKYGTLLYSGFVHDAQKEFAEGCITLALIAEENLPKPETLGVGYAAYLDGLGESVGELRRYILDSLRRGDFSRCEEMLDIMDVTYNILMTMDFPALLIHGLRRTTDAIRGIVERTRGDLTVALKQKELEAKLTDLS
ncbi:MAG: haloacid dehalogenase [Chloroflexi bacterium CG08_land_8_20_14_0_20_45_12]|nr:MAG: haloacid dehalogenase [Chloroflexi bacterium CG08_land_8_20_14_0_20_45_12]PIX26847.1 MAG: haloacid dehalogenase [Chloroflexi bacterium CG_4_8_14_3_um_filter_45_15]